MQRSIEAHSTANIWQLTDLAPVLEIYANQQFDTSGGQSWMPGDPTRQDIFRSVQLSVSSNELVFPTIANIDTTEDSPNNQKATYSAWIRAANREPIEWLLQFRIPPSTTNPISSISWTTLRILKNGIIARNINETLGRLQIMALIEQMIADVSQGVVSETPAGLINGSNTVFTLSHTPVAGSLFQIHNKQIDQEGVDFTITGAVITYAVPPLPGDWLLSSYRTASGILGNAPNTIEGIGTLAMASATTVLNPSVAIDSAIDLIPKSDGITGRLRPSNRVAGISFDVTSENFADSGLFKYIIYL